MTKIRHKSTAYLFLVLTVSAWGSLYVAGRFVLAYLPPFTVLFLRYLVAGIALIIITKIRKPAKIERGDYKYLLFIGVAGYFLGVGAQLLGIKYSNASIASLVNAMNPVGIIIFAVPILKEKITFGKVISVAAAVFGVSVIIGGSQKSGTAAGIFLSIFSVLAWSLMSVAVRRITQKYDSLTVTTYAIIVATVCTLPVCAFELAVNKTAVVLNPMLVLSVLYMGLVCTAMAHALWNRSLSLIEAGSCSLFYPLQPIVAAFLGWLLLGEKISTSFIAGAILIISGIVFSVVSGRKTPQT